MEALNSTDQEGIRLPRTAAADATNGLRAHHICRKYSGGSALAAARSRRLSIPSSAIGSQSSIITRGRFIRTTPQPAKDGGLDEHVGRHAQRTSHTSSTLLR